MPAPGCSMLTGAGGEEETLKGTGPGDEQEEALRTGVGRGDALLGEASPQGSLAALTRTAGVAALGAGQSAQ